MRAPGSDSSPAARRPGRRGGGGTGGFRRAGESAAAAFGPGAAILSTPDDSARETPALLAGAVSSAVTSRLGLASAWMEAAGALTARRCPVSGIASGELRVRVPDARGQRELERHAREIIRRLGARGLAVSMLRLVIDPSLPVETAAPDAGAPGPAQWPEKSRSAQQPGEPEPRLERLRRSCMAAALRRRDD